MKLSLSILLLFAFTAFGNDDEARKVLRTAHATPTPTPIVRANGQDMARAALIVADQDLKKQLAQMDAILSKGLLAISADQAKQILGTNETAKVQAAIKAYNGK